MITKEEKELYLKEHGWQKSEKQNAWMLPHWEKSEEGHYITSLKRAYAQQVKLNRKDD